MKIDSPLRTCEFALQIQSLVFRKPGLYEFQILANNDLIAQKSFHVKEIKKPPQAPPDPGDAPDTGGLPPI